jgi:pilus assembly protein Flp/PilA
MVRLSFHLATAVAVPPSMKKLLRRFANDDEGAALVEYGMLVGLIAVICIVAVTALGTEVSTAFSTIASALSGL